MNVQTCDRHNPASAFLAVALTLTLSACGGGGTSASQPAAETPPAAVDTTAPIITLLGDAELRVEQGTTFMDPGASATDDNDGEVTVVISGDVDSATAGTYTLTYRATDGARLAL